MFMIAGAAGVANVLPRAASLGPLSDWLLSAGARLDGCSSQWLNDWMGVGLIADRDLPAGAVAVSVPRSLLLSRASGMEDAELGPLLCDLAPELQSESNDFDESTAFIALQVLRAARRVQRGEPTKWAPYVASLPREVDSPL
eukprot:6130585-Prymnesium_polylepis.1